MIRSVGVLSAFLVFSCPASAGEQPQATETLYVNPETGSDTSNGTKEKPLKTIGEAANRVTKSTGMGSTTVVLSEGLHAIDKTAVFKPLRKYTKDIRLVIRAETLPNDPEWNPARMPVLISTMPLSKTWMNRPDPFDGVSYGIQIETSHVTIQGLRILGSPVHEHPKSGAVRRNYPIVREGRDLDDLLVTQCLFLGDENAAPNHLPILANGHGIMLDHCVFYGCKMTVVYWTADRGRSTGCGMRNCLVHGAYGCGIWTMSPGEDFEFRNNVIADSLYGWIIEGGNRPAYNVTKSLFSGNKHPTGTGAGPLLNFKVTDPGFLKFAEVTVTDEPVKIDRDQTKKNYLHLIPGTLGADLGAGLFYTKDKPN